MIGSLVGGRYRIDRRLGRGGMGEVWLAMDTRLGRRVALKRMTNVAAATDDDRARLKREAINAAALDHPNVVRIIDLIVDHVDPMLVLEYVPGLTLTEVLRARGALPGNAVARMVGDLARGLTAIHRARFVHRDLKPSNVMIGVGGGDGPRVSILDFGIARSFNDPTQSITEPGVRVGTPTYMSPEQLHALPVDARSDVFALCAVACVMLAGRLVRPRIGDALTLANVEAHEWPASLRQCIAQGLAADPRYRYASTEVFATALASELQQAGDLQQAAPNPRRSTGSLNVMLPTTHTSVTFTSQSADA